MDIRNNVIQTNLVIGKAGSYAISVKPAQQEDTEKAININSTQKEPLDVNKKINDIIKQELKDANDPNKMDRKQLEEVIKEIQEELEFLKNKITFKVEPKYDNSWLVQVINRDSEEVLRQFPPEYLLKISKSMKEMIKGLLVDEKT